MARKGKRGARRRKSLELLSPLGPEPGRLAHLSAVVVPCTDPPSPSSEDVGRALAVESVVGLRVHPRNLELVKGYVKDLGSTTLVEAAGGVLLQEIHACLPGGLPERPVVVEASSAQPTEEPRTERRSKLCQVLVQDVKEMLKQGKSASEIVAEYRRRGYDLAWFQVWRVKSGKQRRPYLRAKRV